MDTTLNQQLILQEEFGRAEAPVLSRQAMGHIGPILIRHGTEEQKAEHLPKMLSGEVLWAQGYSEPGSGSYLASLRTRGEIDGDELVINGSGPPTRVCSAASATPIPTRSSIAPVCRR